MRWFELINTFQYQKQNMNLQEPNIWANFTFEVMCLMDNMCEIMVENCSKHWFWFETAENNAVLKYRIVWNGYTSI